MNQFEKIAICGIGGIFPGSKSLDQFWKHIEKGTDLAMGTPAARWILEHRKVVRGADAGVDSAFHDRGYFIADEDLELPLGRLDLTEDLIRGLDPLFKLTIKAVSDAYFDSNWRDLDKRRVGAIAGNILLPTTLSSQLAREYLGATFYERCTATPAPLPEADPRNFFPAALPLAMAARALGIAGGTFTLDAACSSSLYAIALAMQKLRQGEWDAVIAGGVSRADSLYTQIGFTQLGALSKRGVCAPLDQNGDGLMVGEGAGMFMLKRLSTALAHNDRIYGLISAVGLSNDLGGGLVAPSSEGQVRAMRAAYDKVDFGPRDLQFIECHATGTPLGDKVELTSLAQVFAADKRLTGSCVLGGVKGNIGHLLTASGAAALCKVLLALQHKTLPPTANFQKSSFDLAAHGFEVLHEARPWDVPPGALRRAAVNGFGFGGINAHLLVEEFCAETPACHAVPQLAAVEQGPSRVAVVGIDVATSMHESATRLFGELQNHDVTFRSQCPERRWWGAQGAHWLNRLLPQQQTLAVEALDRVDIPLGLFRIPPNELRQMLPQQLLMLISAHRALHDAGLGREPKLKGGVFIGAALDAAASHYHCRWALDPELSPWLKGKESTELSQLKDQLCPALNADRTLGSLGAITASRITREFGFGGMGFTLSCDENSGLKALDAAFSALRSGALDVAVVGAVDFAASLGHVVSQERWRDAVQDTFSLSAPIYGDGAVSLVLMSEKEALQKGLAIYGYIDSVHSELMSPGAGEVHAPAAQQTSMAAHEEQKPCLGAATGLYAFAHDLLRALARGEQTVQQTGCRSRDGNQVLARFSIPAERGAALKKLSPPLNETAAANPSAKVLSIAVAGAACAWSDLPPAADQNLIMPSLLEDKRIPTLDEQLAGLADTAFLSEDYDPHIQNFLSAAAATARAHAAYLDLAQENMRFLTGALQGQLDLVAGLSPQAGTLLPQPCTAAQAAPMTKRSERSVDDGRRQEPSRPGAAAAPLPAGVEPRKPDAVQGEAKKVAVIDYEGCREFARGKIAPVLGERFAAIDAYPTRVRLPDEPLLLCHRIMRIEGEPLSLGSGRLVTEHDIKPDAFYLDDGFIPISIAVEAGQADLFLSAYLGIDFITKGLAVYRLLDAIVTFHAPLPQVNQTISYDIHLDNFFAQGDTHLFRFGFDATCDGRRLMSMREGVAGFFSEGELTSGKGIIATPLLKTGGVKGQTVEPLVAMRREALDDRALDCLRQGDYVGCFGQDFAALSIQDPKGIPGGMMRLVHRIVDLDPTGGCYQIGKIVGEADIHPDDWFLTCHFVDDQVMPGTLMYECCFHTLRVFLMRMGWVGERSVLNPQPMLGEASRLKCRGQVLATTRKVTYEIHLKEIGYQPDAYAKADALMYSDGKLIVEITGMTLTHPGYTRETAALVWQRKKSAAAPVPATADTSAPVPATADTSALFSCDQIRAFASGKPSAAFGEAYARFDDRRHFVARLPQDPYLLAHRVIAASGFEPMVMTPGGVIEVAYDLTGDEWYFAADKSATMPFCILNEIGLQACGFFAAYMGSALTQKKPLYFRNLSGSGKLRQHVTLSPGTLVTKVRCKAVVPSPDMILQRYEFMIVSSRHGEIYRGETQFGFFTKESLAAQVGLRKVEWTGREQQEVPLLQAESAALIAKLADAPLRMLDEVTVLDPAGGRQGLGFARAKKQVDAAEWFFAAHFLDDPVMPGSLGLESFIQLIKIFAHHIWPNLDPSSAIILAEGVQHDWLYRGQVLSTSKIVEVEAEIHARDEAQGTVKASGFLWVDGLCIYQMKDFELKVKP
jgi:3-oxoacyl-(acyl-carrier-protein) synthase/3-hydroxymyristoyl/3-hydroxydecanoyl-(acyl carrier protein) dehydratase